MCLWCTCCQRTRTFEKLKLLLHLTSLLFNLLLGFTKVGLLESLAQFLGFHAQRLEFLQGPLVDLARRDVFDVFELVHEVLHVELFFIFRLI